VVGACLSADSDPIPKFPLSFPPYLTLEKKKIRVVKSIFVGHTRFSITFFLQVRLVCFLVGRGAGANFVFIIILFVTALYWVI